RHELGAEVWSRSRDPERSSIMVVPIILGRSVRCRAGIAWGLPSRAKRVPPGELRKHSENMLFFGPLSGYNSLDTRSTLRRLATELVGNDPVVRAGGGFKRRFATRVDHESRLRGRRKRARANPFAA